jgi:hypothetical protein
MSSSELAISNYAFSIFTTIFTALALILTLISVVAGLIIEYMVKSSVKKVLEDDIRTARRDLEAYTNQKSADIESLIIRSMDDLSRITKAEIYLQVAYSWWQQYDPFYRRYLLGYPLQSPDEFKSNLSIAMSQTERGLAFIRSIIDKSN